VYRLPRSSPKRWTTKRRPSDALVDRESGSGDRPTAGPPQRCRRSRSPNRPPDLALVLDTGPLLAALDAADQDHDRCATLILETREDLVVPALVLAELDYWCEQRLGTEVWIAFLDDVIAGAYRVEAVSGGDLERCRELQARYLDLRLGVTDASVIALAERLGEAKVATLDHRHFGVVRPRHVDALELLP
jgi:predicted nucleic acid-binding protein